ncbi:MAG: hypothetical protein HW379_929 [Actinobacteria bacterium]|nr:hypothetical protein [Actinomycetota bacterium]
MVSTKTSLAAVYYFFANALKKAIERKALTIDATITARTAMSCVCISLKAKFAMKIATVKPIPAALPVASNDDLFLARRKFPTQLETGMRL